jgi:hypothetical protein
VPGGAARAAPTWRPGGPASGPRGFEGLRPATEPIGAARLTMLEGTEGVGLEPRRSAPSSASPGELHPHDGPEAPPPGRVGSRRLSRGLYLQALQTSRCQGERRGWDSNPHTLARAGFQDRFLSHSDTPPSSYKMANRACTINASGSWTFAFFPRTLREGACHPSEPAMRRLRRESGRTEAREAGSGHVCVRQSPPPWLCANCDPPCPVRVMNLRDPWTILHLSRRLQVASGLQPGQLTPYPGGSPGLQDRHGTGGLGARIPTRLQDIDYVGEG